jgi:hypothetical protein
VEENVEENIEENVEEDMFVKLEKLSILKDKGIISSDEFELKKKQILGI